MATTRLFAASLAVVVPVALSVTQVVARSDEVRDVDTYAIYASVLPESLGDTGFDSSHVGILDETHADLSCLSQVGPDWSSAADDYKRQNAGPRKLPADADLQLPYDLLSREHVTRMVEDARALAPSQDPMALLVAVRTYVYQTFRGDRIFALSAVGFDATKTRAVVTVEYDCGFDCVGGWQYERQNVNGQWVQPPDVTSMCLWGS